MVKCPTCGCEVMWQRHLKRHMASRMCKPGPHNCPICQASFPNHSSLRSHERKCRKCAKCDEIYQTGNPHHCGSYKCPECSKDFQLEPSMKRHWRKHHPESAPARDPHRITPGTEFKCCGETFKNGRQLHTHKLINHYRRGDEGTGLDVPSTYATYSCSWPKCNGKFTSNRELTDHYATIHDQGNPSTSTQQSNSDEGSDVPSTSATFSCTWPKCKAKFPTERELKDHYMVHGQGTPSTSSSSRRSDSEEEEDEEDDTDQESEEVVDSKGALKDKRVYKQIGTTFVDKAGLANFRSIRERSSFRLTKFGKRLCGRGLGIEVLETILDDALDKYRRKGGKMQVKILAESLDYPISTPLFATVLYNPLMLLNYVESVLGSKDRFLLDNDLTIDVIHIAI